MSGVFRVVKTITLISVKCLIHSNLHGAPTTSALRTGVRHQPDGLSEANLQLPTTARRIKKTLKRRNLYEFSRKFIDIRKIIFILAETTWDIVPKHY